MTRVLIVDDQPAFRTQLRRLLARAGLNVVGEAGDIPQASAQALSLRPDLAIVDVMLPGINGVDGTLRLKAAVPELRVILISAHRDQAGVLRDAAGRPAPRASSRRTIWTCPSSLRGAPVLRKIHRRQRSRRADHRH